MKLITYNLWHGLDPSSKLYFRALEPKVRRQKRREVLFRLIEEQQPDVCFFQEICPLNEMGEELEGRLGLRGYLQGDLMGVRAFGVGAPWNLHSGLGVFVKDQWLSRVVFKQKLSGPAWSFAGVDHSFQLGECRYAMGVEVDHPRRGRLLFVGLHLHHGLELSESLSNEVMQWCKQVKASVSLKAELIARLRAGDERRERELDELFRWLGSQLKRYAQVFIGGDFNFDPGHALSQKLRSRQFVHLSEGRDKSLATWNPTKNTSFRLNSARPSFPILIEDLTFETNALERLRTIIHSAELEPRQLDQIWAFGGSPETQHVGLLGDRDDLTASDHFGLVVELN